MGPPSTTAVKKCEFTSVCAAGDAASDRRRAGRARPRAVQKPRLRRRLAQGHWVSEEAKAEDRAIVPDVTVVLRETGSWP